MCHLFLRLALQQNPLLIRQRALGTLPVTVTVSNWGLYVSRWTLLVFGLLCFALLCFGNRLDNQPLQGSE